MELSFASPSLSPLEQRQETTPEKLLTLLEKLPILSEERAFFLRILQDLPLPMSKEDQKLFSTINAQILNQIPHLHTALGSQDLRLLFHLASRGFAHLADIRHQQIPEDVFDNLNLVISSLIDCFREECPHYQYPGEIYYLAFGMLEKMDQFLQEQPRFIYPELFSLSLAYIACHPLFPLKKQAEAAQMLEHIREDLSNLLYAKGEFFTNSQLPFEEKQKLFCAFCEHIKSPSQLSSQDREEIIQNLNEQILNLKHINSSFYEEEKQFWEWAKEENLLIMRTILSDPTESKAMKQLAQFFISNALKKA